MFKVRAKKSEGYKARGRGKAEGIRGHVNVGHGQESITRSMQLPHIPVMVFSCVFL